MSGRRTAAWLAIALAVSISAAALVLVLVAKNTTFVCPSGFTLVRTMDRVSTRGQIVCARDFAQPERG